MTLSPTALEEAAKAIAASYGEDPDDYASLLDICGPNNEPLLTWQKYAEQSTAAITAYLAQAGKEGWVMVPRTLSNAEVNLALGRDADVFSRAARQLMEEVK